MDFKELATFRRELHQYPELSGREEETAKRVSRYLSDLNGWELTHDVGGHGLIAHYESGYAGKHTIFRSELDALPIREQTQLAYASVNEGVAHHCGHDGHTAILCGLARLISDNPIKSGSVTLLFQPAEETGEGAQAILDDPRFRNLKPDYFIALHNIPGESEGVILVKPGTMLVASTGVQVKLQGKTSHAAQPEEGSSPWQALRTLADDMLSHGSVSLPLAERAKITLVGLHLGGPNFGTSPGDATAWFTLRAYKNHILLQMIETLKKRADGIVAVYGLSCEISTHEHFDATVNDEGLVECLKKLALDDGLTVKNLTEPYSYSEDFGRFTSVAPSLFFGLGSGKNQPPLHSSEFDFPDDLLPAGVQILDLLTRYFHK